jgi:hypothetical protein
MAWDSVGFPTTAIDRCEVFFETNSPKGSFSLNTCTFNINAKEAPHQLYSGVSGDLNMDGAVDAFDIIACRKAIISEDYSGYDVKAGDLNGNDRLDVGDLILLKKFVLGIGNE